MIKKQKKSKKPNLEKLNNSEISLINQFKLHPLFVNLNTIVWDDFLSILIQRRFLSLSIVNVYEFVIDALDNEDVKKTVRKILQEEYPRNAKGLPLLSHRELLFQDLINLGATKSMILGTSESPITKQVREASHNLLWRCLDHQYCEVGLITLLRFWAEVLVAIEYKCLWQRISERLSDGKGKSKQKKRSEFYYFHMIHDSRKCDIGKEGFCGGLTHSQELAIHLHRMISSEDCLDYCIDIERQIFNLKYDFYNQFLATIPPLSLS